MINRVKQIAEYYCRGNMAEFARVIGVKQAAMAAAVGRGSCSLDMALKIIDAYEGVSAEWLLKGRGEMLKEKTLSGQEIEQLKNRIAELERRNEELENDKRMYQILISTLSSKVGVTLNNAQFGTSNTQNITDPNK